MTTRLYRKKQEFTPLVGCLQQMPLILNILDILDILLRIATDRRASNRNTVKNS